MLWMHQLMRANARMGKRRKCCRFTSALWLGGMVCLPVRNSSCESASERPHLEHVRAPRQQRQGVDVGIHRRVRRVELRTGVRAAKTRGKRHRTYLVGNRVVHVVLVLPPRHAEALHTESALMRELCMRHMMHLADVAKKDASQVVQRPVGEHLVVQEVVGQPAALLPEQSLRSVCV